MYVQYGKNGKINHEYQSDHYGHPSKAGFKDVIHTWKTEKWNPDALLERYKRAGARYFMGMANHHDNFDNFASDFQTWNSVAIGPKQDIIRGWEKATRKVGIPFAVSIHAARAWDGYQEAQGSDKDGPLSVVPYDGKMTRADGKGLWWEGLDPQELYAQNHMLHEKMSEAYIEKFYHRTINLIDKNHPEMIYFDDSVLPFVGKSDAGLRIAAHLHNTNLKRTGNRLDAVLTGKNLNDQQRKCLVLDIERGVSGKIETLPWQTDTCIGQWHYSRSLFDLRGYKKPLAVVHMLVDIVSKNRNLMLNIPLPGSGEPDTEELAFLEDFTRWMDVNSEGIYATRPWKVYGEGPAVEAEAISVKS